MKNLTSKLVAALKNLAREEGQDLVEYALLVALIAFGATVAVKSVGTNLSTAFTSIGTAVTTNIN